MKNADGKKGTITRDFGISIVAVDDDGKSLGLGTNSPFPDISGPKNLKENDKEKTISSRPLPKNSKIQLKMFFPEKKNLNLVKAHGTIKWIKQVKTPDGKYFLIGVSFKEATKQEKDKITKLWKTHRT